MAVVDWIKDPDDVLDWTFDWSNWLAAGETISTSTFTVSAGVTQNSSTNTTTTTVVWLSGGTTGQLYTISNTITTSQGRTKVKTITLRVKDQ